MHGRITIMAIAWLTFLGGCSELPAPTSHEQDAPVTLLAQSFDPSATGTIQGRVVWDGAVPVAEETLVRVLAFNPKLWQNPARFRTPHIPKVDPRNQGVENAVVFLRNVDPRRSKPWDHAKVRVEFQNRQLRIQQDDSVCQFNPRYLSIQKADCVSQLGFVRRGSAIEIVNRDSEYHNLRVRGAAFFGMPLVEANQVHERVLGQTGVVDLTCQAGYYWLHAHLFVTEHPYYIRTDADGRFVLDHVPAGEYEVVCWLPSWKILRQERDPETAVIARFIWETPKEQVRTVQVQAGRAEEITYRWDSVDEPRPSGSGEPARGTAP